MKKKIVIIGPAYPYRGGNPTFVTFVHDVLSKEFDVKIYNYKLLYPGFLFPGTTQFDKSEKTFKKAPSERVVNSINPFNWIAVARKLKKENADLIVFNWWHPFFAFCHFTISLFARSKYKGKTLFITENFISHEGHFIDRVLTGIGLSNADAFLALSSEVESDLKNLKKKRRVYRSELPVYSFYSDLEPQNKEVFGFGKDDTVLLFFGYVRKYKGLDILLEAMPQILKKDNRIKLLVVGEFYDDPESYNSIISKHSLSPYVKIVNQYVPNEDIEKYYKASDAVILPYRSATQSGILNLAYGFFLPVVATKVGGFMEFIDDGKTGILVEPDDPNEIARGVEKYLDLREKVNFKSNIENRVSGNQFNRLPELFNTIIRECVQ
ncbi:MAG: glycosyltransferase [Ignavibacteriaceae bacterium]|jgi:glycosyltransferase involved in cell wall biosynthesis|nr:glycosyltransferase [Ignavibacteriaceae bacterium]HPO56026.1 glycosyltransferase [Ignavibacteriaceae bacterium]